MYFLTSVRFSPNAREHLICLYMTPCLVFRTRTFNNTNNIIVNIILLVCCTRCYFSICNPNSVRSVSNVLDVTSDKDVYLNDVFLFVLYIEKKNIKFPYLLGALHEARTLDGIATIFAAQSIVVIAAVGIVVFVFFPHHSRNANKTNNKSLNWSLFIQVRVSDTRTFSADELTSRQERAVDLRTEVWLWLHMLKSMFVLLSNLKTKYYPDNSYSTNFTSMIQSTTISVFSKQLTKTHTHTRLISIYNCTCNLSNWYGMTMERINKTGVCF